MGVFGAGWPDCDGVGGDIGPGAVVAVVARWAEAGDAPYEGTVGAETVTCFALFQSGLGDGNVVGAESEMVGAESEVFQPHWWSRGWAGDGAGHPGKASDPGPSPAPRCRRTTPDRPADLPLMTERVQETSEPPFVLFLDGRG